MADRRMADEKRAQMEAIDRLTLKHGLQLNENTRRGLNEDRAYRLNFLRRLRRLDGEMS